MKKSALVLLFGIMIAPTLASAKFNNLCQAESDSEACKKTTQVMYKGVMQGFVSKTVALRQKNGQKVDLKDVQQEADEFIPYSVFESVFNKCGEKSADQKEIGKCMMDLFGDRAVSVLMKKYQPKTK